MSPPAEEKKKFLQALLKDEEFKFTVSGIQEGPVNDAGTRMID